MKRIGIMSAMSEEIDKLIPLIEHRQTIEKGMRTYHVGTLYDKEVVVVFSHWGKVAAATTVTTLILDYQIDTLIFTGVAGGIAEDLKIGDIVIGDKFIQHDMDARPIFAQFELPIHKKLFIESDLQLSQKAFESATQFVNQDYETTIPSDIKNYFSIQKPKVIRGDIASGDKFVDTEEDRKVFVNQLKSVVCVEMEGAAVAQVCYEYQIPFTVIRTISDTADKHSQINFPHFINTIASNYSVGIIKQLLNKLAKV